MSNNKRCRINNKINSVIICHVIKSYKENARAPPLHVNKLRIKICIKKVINKMREFL